MENMAKKKKKMKYKVFLFIEKIGSHLNDNKYSNLILNMTLIRNLVDKTKKKKLPNKEKKSDKHKIEKKSDKYKIFLIGI